MLYETERAAIAVVLDRNDLAPLLFDNLDASHFHGPNLVVFDAVKDLAASGMDFRWATIKDHVGGKLPVAYWTALMDSTRGLHASGYEPFLREKVHTLKTEYGKRRMLAHLGEVVDKATLEDDDITALDTAVQQMRLVGRPKETPGFGDAVMAYQEHIRQASSEITTGYAALDWRIDGFNAGELVMLMARSGVGKTWLALNIIKHLAGRVPFKIALFSLEMPKAAIAERLLELHFGLSRREVKERAIAGTLDMAEFEYRFGRLDVYDKIYSVSEIRKTIEREGYRVVFIDFLHLIRSEIIGSPYQQISAVMAGLKQAAKDTGCVAFLLHQLSRQAGSGGDPVEAAHARDSGQVEELSDFIVGVWAPGLKADAPEEFSNTLRIRLLKNKRGERWIGDFHFDKTCGQIMEVETPGGGAG